MSIPKKTKIHDKKAQEIKINKCKICGNEIKEIIVGMPNDVCWDCLDENDKLKISNFASKVELPISKSTKNINTLSTRSKSPEMIEKRVNKFEKLKWKKKK